MPNNRFLRVLHLNPRMVHIKHHLRHFNDTANPTVHGEGLTNRIRHRLTSNPLIPNNPNSIIHISGDGMGHKHRRPAPLKFKL